MGTSVRDKSQCITNEDIDNLRDNNYPKVILSNGCYPARFNKDCIAEHFLNKKNGGVIAFFGNTDMGYYPEHIQLNNLLNAAFAKNPSSPLQFSLGYIRNQLNNGNTYDNRRMHLLGDPETPLWTSSPSTLNVTVTPGTITSGENNIYVTVNNLPVGEKAQICLMKGDEAYKVLTVSDRNAQKFSFTPRTSGNLDVTVTAHNFKPYEAVIPVIGNEGSAIRISNLSFNDSKTINNSNNEDRQLDAGETIELNVQLKNGGWTPATGLVGKLSCKSNHIELLTDRVNFGDIFYGNTGYGQTTFKFRIKEDAPEIRKNDFQAIRFDLDVTGSDGIVYPDTFKIDVFNSNLSLLNQRVQGPLVAGCQVQLYICLQNLGQATTNGVTATLSPMGTSVKSISVNTALYSAMGKNEGKCNITPFVLTLSDDYRSGGKIFLNLDVKNIYGKSWKYQFDITEKCNKMNRVFAYSDYSSIKLSWDMVTTNVGGLSVAYNVYRSDNGPTGDFTLQNPVPLTSCLFVDTNIDTGNTYYYKVAGIARSGNFGEQSELVAARACYPLMGKFPRTTQYSSGNNSSVNVCDLNGDGKKALFAGSSLNLAKAGNLIGLDYEGNDLINKNPAYIQGIAKLPAPITATPAIGDINGNGEQCVVVPTWGGSYAEDYVVRCYSITDKNNDKQADIKWENVLRESVYRGIVLSNLDNSSDGTLETVVRSIHDSTLKILDNQGKVKSSFGQGTTHSMVAVADLDGDGKKEIIAAYDTIHVNKVPQKGGIYIWKFLFLILYVIMSGQQIKMSLSLQMWMEMELRI